jgi:hypothetical protein
VSVTSPAGGSTVSGTVSVAAGASDNVGVAGVQFLLDGANLGAEDTTAPYSVSWNTATAANGAHTLTARARDAAGNVTTSSAVTVTVSNQAPTGGLVAAYGFNEGSGTTAADGSGGGHAGTISGATWTTAGRFGNALSFDGVNDWVTVGDAAALDLTTALTLEAWVRPSALTGWRTVLMKEAGTEQVYAIFANEDVARPIGTVRTGGAYRIAPGAAALPLDTWTHLAGTYDGTTLRLYVNGTLAGSVAASGSVEVSSGALRVGGNAIWGEYFSGLIDEVRVYGRALTQAEIQTDMDTPVGSPERLLGEAAAGDGAVLSQRELRPIFGEAVARWSAVLGDAEAVERLRAVRVEVLDLPGATLGLADGSVVYLDADGAGRGWFLDPTPAGDAEFALPGDQGERGRVDLLTVVAHELGHVLGLGDDPGADPFTGSVMADVLPPGVRRVHLEGLLPDAPLSNANPPAPGMARAASRSVGSHPRPAHPKGLMAEALPVDAGVAVILKAIPVIEASFALTGPVSSGCGDEKLVAAVAMAWQPAAFSPEDFPSGIPVLLAPRARVADRSTPDSLFADWGLTPDDTFPGDWWL